MKRWHMDLSGPHVRSKTGKCFILVCVDSFSRFAETCAIPDKKATMVAEALVTQVFTCHGTPKSLMSDLGREFQNSIMEDVCRLLEVEHLRTTAYKPSTNGTVERLNRTLNAMLGKVIADHQQDWCQHLPYIMSAYNSSRHVGTHYSPNFLVYGREIRMPLDILYGSSDISQGVTQDEYAEQLIQCQPYKLVCDHMKLLSVRMKHYDSKVKDIDFYVGDWVWVYSPRRYIGRSPKWSRQYGGPFLIEKDINAVNYIVRRSKRAQPIIVHADKLKKCHGVTPPSWFESHLGNNI